MSQPERNEDTVVMRGGCHKILSYIVKKSALIQGIETVGDDRTVAAYRYNPLAIALLDFVALMNLLVLCPVLDRSEPLNVSHS